MKIIASLDPTSYQESFLVEMTGEEIARVAGYRYKSECSIRIGRELPVSKLFDLIVQLRNSPERMKTAINTLAALVGRLAQ